ncbi:MAG: ATP-binding protein [Acidobacteria bacterium]|nr:ATP-binding protein [Acidobacteriota bacterium]
MQDFEKLGLFYLGREYDLAAGTPTATPVLYDSRDLVTHAVCVGMTGSGKTGLCIGLLEEALLDGVPVIAIDPKGDLGNMLLTFPGLSGRDFAPWIDEDEARRAGQAPEAFAAEQAHAWKDGLAQSGQDADRIQRLKAAADFAIYTPGSRAGLPVSVLSSFAAPPANVREDAELLSDRASNTATSVLALAGVDGPPRSREHTLLATLFSTAWCAGKALDLPSLILQVQTPLFQKVGILDIESFFPQKERFELSLKLNGILAAPGFDQWFEGEPLDPAALLRTPEGKPRASIFSIAHLGETERMFFVSLLLNQFLGWMRTQSGTSSLRAILYMDEIAGYFPPVANPPAKPPLLTMLKQARAFGVGVVLATQNPVDLDYKGLSNAGTWFLGRLQTERDKARVLDGLEGVAAGSLDRAEADRILSGLGKRVFLLHNVHESKPVIFQTRWTMSYLRGPLSKTQIRSLMESRKAPATGAPAPASREAATRARSTNARPVLPPGIEQYFLPDPATGRGDVDAPTYVPVVLGAARVAFTDPKAGIDTSKDLLYAVPVTDSAVPVEWQQAVEVQGTASGLRREPASADAGYADVPAPAQQPRNYAAWQKSFSQWLSQSQRLDLLRHRATKLTSNAGEEERDFRARVQDSLREARDGELEAVRKKVATKREAIAERLRKAEAAVGRETQQASQQKTQTMLSMGAAAIGALLGRKVISTGTLGRATTAARGVGRSMKEADDVKRAGETVTTLRTQLETFDQTVRDEMQAVSAKYEGAVELEQLALAPKRGQVQVQFVGLGWDPQ